MHKLLAALILLGLCLAIIFLSLTEEKSRFAAKSIEARIEDRIFSPEFQEALKIMEDLQSLALALHELDIISHEEILKLEEKVLHVKQIFADNPEKLQILTIDTRKYENALKHLLAINYPNSSESVHIEIIRTLKQPSAFISSSQEYKAILEPKLERILQKHGLPTLQEKNISEVFLSQAMQISWNLRETLARKRGNEWIHNLEKTLCEPISTNHALLESLGIECSDGQ